MRLALAQINPLVGDLAGNGQLLLEACRQASAVGADLVVAPELELLQAARTRSGATARGAMRSFMSGVVVP